MYLYTEQLIQTLESLININKIADIKLLNTYTNSKVDIDNQALNHIANNGYNILLIKPKRRKTYKKININEIIHYEVNKYKLIIYIREEKSKTRSEISVLW